MSLRSYYHERVEQSSCFLALVLYQFSTPEHFPQFHLQNMKNIAIIGSGPSGLVSAKEALANGLNPIIFEKFDQLGGVWKPGKDGGVWSTLETNTSIYVMSFGDTPFENEDGEEHWVPALNVYKYLLRYAKKWGLESHIRFNCEVTRAVANSGGSEGWSLEWKDPQGKDQKEDFHGLIVATGTFSIPSLPTDIKGLNDFPGPVLHSQQYKVSKDFKGKRVLMLGGSISSNEIIADLAVDAESIVHCFKRSFFTMKRWAPHPDQPERHLPADLLSLSRKMNSPAMKAMAEEDKLIAMNTALREACAEQMQVPALKIEDGDLKYPIQVTISDKYLDTVKNSGKVIIERTGIQEVKGNIVILENGKEYEVDAIILATGYYINISFFDEEVLEKLSFKKGNRVLPIILYEGCMHPELDNLYFVGVAREPAFLNIEQLARLAARIFSGKINKPSLEIMKKGLEKIRAVRESGSKTQFPYGHFQIWTDSLATLNGSLDIDKLLDENSTLEDVFEGINLPEELKGKETKIKEMMVQGSLLACHYNFKERPKQVLEHMEKMAEILK